MIFDARGLKHPKPLETIREHFRDNCRKEIDFKLLVDTTEYAKTVRAFAKMSKCTTEIERGDGHYVIRVHGNSCACN
ncbi:hypothetical protein ACFLZI_01875 [Nitrospirota bacterium]